ncbi:autotransporter domain-containing protein [Sphingomicrobium sp. XHP0235]|uniref:autotransporter domain-containing protein n=1 Tax=Sphingomicrobium aquimarinum TaxID=3133971 RepID=UPI0031FED38A
MTKIHLLRASMLGAVAAIALPQAAQAQRIDRIVAFGDSYADDGNAFELGGIDPVTTVVYSNGRFSDGTNYIDSLSDILNAPVDNFAIGGAQADGDNVNAGLPGLDFQIGSFLAGGSLGIPGVPNVFPSVSGTFDENDLVTFNIGGNDSRDYQLLGGTVAGASAAAQGSIAGATQALGAVVQAGARNISWIGGNSAALPEVVAQPNPASAAAIRTAYNDAYVAGVTPVLAQLASQGVMVHYLDLDVVGANISNNLDAFGFSSLSCTPFNPANPATLGCALDSAVASQSVYYGDGVHLTSAGFNVIARYVALQLDAPLKMDGPSTLAMENAQRMNRVIEGRLASRSPRDGDYAQGLAVYVQGDGFTRTTIMTDHSDSFRMNGAGVSAGLELGFGNGMVGIAGHYSKPEGEYADDANRVDGETWSGAVYGTFAIGPLFLEAHGGLGTGQYEIGRVGVIDELSLYAESERDHMFAGGRVGYLANIAGARIGPVVGVSYTDVDGDTYSQSGDPALALTITDPGFSSLRGNAGLEMRGDFAGYGIQIRPWANLLAEQELDADQRTYSFFQNASPTIVNSWMTEEVSDEIYGRVAGGFSARLGSAVDLNAGMSFSLWKDDGNDASAQVGLSLGF